MQTRGVPSADAESAEALLLAHLPALDRIVGILCVRHGLDGADAEDFDGWVRMRLVENEYAVLRKFAGRASAATYLSVVVANLLRDYRNRRHGRWRPSAAARRLGPVAERLERLVYRDGLGLVEAARSLRSEGLTDAGDRELAELLDRLPVRPALRPRPAGDEPLSTLASPDRADSGVEAEEARRERTRLREALADALASLPAEDRLIVRMRFWDELTVAEIARGLGLDQKPLYRRIERLISGLRERMRAADIGADRALSFIGAAVDDGGWDFPGPDPSIGEE